MTPFEVVSELRVGSILEVTGTALKVELDSQITELTRTYNGYVYAIGQIGSVVKIHFGRQILLAYVRLLRMRSELERMHTQSSPPPAEDSRILEADLFGEGVWNPSSKSFKFRRGVRIYPLPGQRMYLTTQEELKFIYESAENTRGRGEAREKTERAVSPMARIGSYVGSISTPCFADLDRMFGQHCALLGSTGTGKSSAVAALIHSVLDLGLAPKAEDQPSSADAPPGGLRPRVLIIDPHGEYATCFGDRAKVYHAYSREDGPEGSDALHLP